jgi:hypothetical protein
MKNFVGKIKRIIPLLVEDYTAADSGTFDFICKKNQMIRELDFCRKTGALVGVYSKQLGDGLFLLGVEDLVYAIKDDLVIFHPYDMTGFELRQRSIHLSEIHMIIPFNNRYIKPNISIPTELVEVGKYINSQHAIEPVL